MIAEKILLFIMLINALITRTHPLKMLNFKNKNEQKLLLEIDEFSKIHIESTNDYQEPTSISIDTAIESGEFNDWKENNDFDKTDSMEDQQFINTLTGIKVPEQVTKLSDSLKFEFWTLQKDDPKRTYGYIFNFFNVNLIKYVWEKEQPLIVVVHGWLAGHNEAGIFSIKKAYTLKKQYNVLTLDWSIISAPLNYFAVAKKCKDVGTVLSHFLIKLMTLRLIDPSQIHMIGHSLGAHILGACGSSIYELTNKKIGRITGLDPSGPAFTDSWYYWGGNNKRLEKKDAEFVDVIHTARGMTGYIKQLGHVDFYPNNGKSPQPGCGGKLLSFSKALSCSHARAYVYYNESLNNQNAFPSLECKSNKNYKQDKCVNNVMNQMGYNIDTTKHGKFYLETGDQSPFSRELKVHSKRKSKEEN